MAEEKLKALLERVAGEAAGFRASAGERKQRPELGYEQMRARFAAAAPESGAPVEQVIAELSELVAGGLANMTGPRFFGWVIGASAPAGLAADWLTSAWAQNCGNSLATPAASACEQTAGRWLLELMNLPRDASVGFVTGGTMANFTCLAAARGEVLARVGWDVESDGLIGAPAVHVVLGEEAHSTVFAALRYLGLGSKRVHKVTVDGQGRISADAFARTVEKLDGPIIAIAQAGHINSGAFDPFNKIAEACAKKSAWLHVDGAIGLWALAVPELAHLTQGLARADSWGADGHKWLQTPHDCGYAIVRNEAAHRRAMSIAASYLPVADGVTHPWDYVPELSRRARGFSTWAMLKHLGREGLAAMVNRHCALARRMGELLRAEPGVEVMNEIVLNQVAVRFSSDLEADAGDALTQRVIARVQSEGECFLGGAQWRERQIMRISVIGEATTERDIERAAAAILRAWRAER